MTLLCPHKPIRSFPKIVLASLVSRHTDMAPVYLTDEIGLRYCMLCRVLIIMNMKIHLLGCDTM
jgi:hypothetical protein